MYGLRFNKEKTTKLSNTQAGGSQFTASMWVKPTGTGVQDYPFSWTKSDEANKIGGLKWRGGDSALSVYSATAGSESTATPVTSATWHHAVIQYDGSNVTNINNGDFQAFLRLVHRGISVGNFGISYTGNNVNF